MGIEDRNSAGSAFSPARPSPVPLEKNENHTPLYSNYKNTFSKLNSSHTHKIAKIIQDIINKIVSLIDKILGLETDKDYDLNWQVHLAAEHMSQGKLKSNSFLEAVEKTLKLLNQLENSPTEVIKTLEYAHRYANWNPKKSSSAEMVKQIKQDIANLPVGGRLAIQSSTENHAMIMMIACTGMKEDGSRLYKVTQHNEGNGVERYHYEKIAPDGRHLFQTALEIIDVPEAKLISAESLFIEKVFKNIIFKDVDHLYLEIIPLLGGKVAPPSEHEKLWRPGQMGGSCTTCCLLSLISSETDEKTYNRFMEFAQYEILLKTYKEIKSGWENRSIKKILALEIVKDLCHQMQSRGIDLPPEFLDMQQQLKNEIQKKGAKIEENIFWSTRNLDKHPHLIKEIKAANSSGKVFEIDHVPLTVHLDENGRIQSSNMADNLMIAFILLSKGKFDSEKIVNVMDYIDKVIQLSSKSSSVEENNKLVEVFLLMINFFKAQPLNRDQIYIMTAISSALLNKHNELRDQNIDEIKRKKIKRFCLEIHSRYNSLNLGSFFRKAPFDDIISFFQKFLFKPRPPSTSLGLKKLIAKLAVTP